MIFDLPLLNSEIPGMSHFTYRYYLDCPISQGYEIEIGTLEKLAIIRLLGLSPRVPKARFTPWLNCMNCKIPTRHQDDLAWYSLTPRWICINCGLSRKWG
jgi:hypothetical protein